MSLNLLSTYILVLDDFLSQDCLEAVEKFVEEKQQHKYHFKESFRQCEALDISVHVDPLTYAKVTGEVNRCLAHYRKTLDPTGYIFRLGEIEVPRFLRYVPGGDHFHSHIDAWEKSTANRGLSVIFYLSECEGGETEFNTIKVDGETLKVPPKRGRVVMFPSSYPFAHQGNQVKSGSKDIIVTWIRY